MAALEKSDVLALPPALAQVDRDAQGLVAVALHRLEAPLRTLTDRPQPSEASAPTSWRPACMAQGLIQVGKVVLGVSWKPLSGEDFGARRRNERFS